MTTLQAATYLRMSLDKTGEHLGVERQRDACLKICAERGWEPVEYLDNSVSATKARGAATGYGRLLADAQAGRINAVVVWDLDRLTRRPREIEDWLDLAERHAVRIVTVDGEVDSASDNGRLYMRIKAAVARHEVEAKARRQRAAHEQRAASGLPPAGHRALGWERDGMTVISTEAQLVRQAADDVLAGASLRAVARSWNDQGSRTSKGQPWAPYSVRSVLLNPRTAALSARSVGRNRWEIVGPGQWPALIPEDTWRAVGRILTDPGRKTTRSVERVSMLSGLARCGECGRPVITGGTSRGVRTYKCLPVLHLSRAAAPVEDYVSAVVVARLSRPDAAALLSPDCSAEITRLRGTLDAKRRHLADLAELVADGTFTKAQARTAAERLRGEIAEAEGDLAEVGRTDVLAPLVASVDVAARWEELSVNVRRGVVEALAEVTIYPPGRGAKVFDPATVEIEWRSS